MIDPLHEAIEQSQVVQLNDRDDVGTSSLREVEPRCLGFWGVAWTLGTWCRLRSDFRNFHSDRVAELTASNQVVQSSPSGGLHATVESAGVASVQTLDERDQMMRKVIAFNTARVRSRVSSLSRMSET